MSTHTSVGGRPPAEQTGNVTYLSAAQVRTRYGGVSDMAIWRWLRDESLGFPKPMRIKGRRFWLVSSLVAWECTRAPTPSAHAAAQHPSDCGNVET